MTVNAHNPPNVRKQRVRSPRLVIIEFVLAALPHVGTAGRILYFSLTQNYKIPTKLHHELIVFDIKDEGALAEHTAHMSQVVKELRARYVLILLILPLTKILATGISIMLW